MVSSSWACVADLLMITVFLLLVSWALPVAVVEQSLRLL